MPVQEVQAKTTSAEFVMWMAYLEQDQTDHRREDYYMAQVAAEIRRGNSKKPQKIRVDDFLLKYSKKKERQSTDEQKNIFKGIARALQIMRKQKRGR